MKRLQRLLRRGRKQNAAGALVGVVLLSLTACSTQPAMPEFNLEVARVSAVAVAKPGFKLEAGASLAWRTELLWVGDGGSNPALAHMDVQREIERQLKAEGFNFVADTKADYVLVAAAVIGNNRDGAALTELTRLYPGLSQVAQTLDPGTLMLGLGRPGSPVVLWRSSEQTMIDDKMASQLREARLESVVRSLLTTLPMSRTPESQEQ